MMFKASFFFHTLFDLDLIVGIGSPYYVCRHRIRLCAARDLFSFGKKGHQAKALVLSRKVWAVTKSAAQRFRINY